METNVKAFFYEYKYYLFPADCPDLRELKTRSIVIATRLKEERCMAPDFIYESMTEETLEITNPEHLFATMVNLYHAREYDELLAKQVDRVCPGCEKYHDDGNPDLDGHHREISLSGICYEKEREEDKWDFATCVDVFWYRMAKKVNELAACIDKGDMKKLNKICNDELGHIFYPVRFWGGVKDGKYVLGFAPDCHHAIAFRLLLAYMSHSANSDENHPMKKTGWEICPYREKGVFTYSGKITFKGGVAKLAPSPNPNAYVVTLYSKHPEKETPDGKLCSDFYDYLCAALGEEKVSAMVHAYDFTNEKEGLTTIEDIVRMLEEKHESFSAYKDLSFGDAGSEVYPMAIGYSTTSMSEVHNLPFREKIAEGMTCCPDIAFVTRDDLDEAWWLNFVGFCYLYVPRPIEEALEPVMWYLANANLIPEPYRNPNDLRATGGSLGFADCGDGFIVDSYIACENKFYRTLRAIAPVMQAFDVRLTVVNKDGVMTYGCGYEFLPLEEV